MKKAKAKKRGRTLHGAVGADDILPEYDFSNGRPNPYAARLRGRVTAVVLDSDVAADFPDSAAVNDALRALSKIAARKAPKRGPRRRTA